MQVVWQAHLPSPPVAAPATSSLEGAKLAFVQLEYVQCCTWNKRRSDRVIGPVVKFRLY